MTRELLQQALAALEYHRDQTRPIDRTDAAITALREALAAPQPEPVATVVSWTNGSYWRNYQLDWHKDVEAGAKLYDTPPAAPADSQPCTTKPVVSQKAVNLADNADMVMVPRNSLQAIDASADRPDFIRSTVRFLLAAAPAPADWGTPHDVSGAPWQDEPAPAVPLQGGMDNNELLAAWQKKLPGRVPEGQELSAFAVGTEVGFEHAQKLERMDWDRVHHVLAKHGKHPGRTDDHLADVIDKALSAAPAVREPQPECVPCQRCGFENWIQDGESPGQTTARMNMRAHGIGGGGNG